MEATQIRGKFDDSLLVTAVGVDFSGSIEICQALLKAAVDTNDADEDGKAPLLWAVRNRRWHRRRPVQS